MNVLVVAAHPDDEVLGCGASIARHAAAGDAVHVLILAEGLTSRGRAGAAALRKLRADAQKAARVLGAQPPVFGGLPDNRLDTVALLDVVKLVEREVARVRPAVVYTHHAGDLNVDHRVAHQAVLTACRPLPASPVGKILCFEVPSSTEWQAPGSAPAFAPNVFHDVAKSLSRKLAALRAYAGEMRRWPHPRSLKAVEHLARWRGATIGADAAEAFVLARAVERP